MSLLTPPRLPELAPDARIVPAATVIGVVDTLPGAPIAAYLAERLGARAVRTRLLVRHKPGFDLQPSGAAAHPDALLEATRALLASLPAGAVVIAEGPALLATLVPRLAILGAPSPSLITLDPDVRALRDRFDLVVHDFRPGTLERLVAALAG